MPAASAASSSDTPRPPSVSALTIRTRSPSGSAAATSSAARTLESSRSRRRSTTRWPVRPIGSGSGSSARPARWSASRRLAASTSTSGNPPAAATSSRRTAGAADPGVAQDLVGHLVGHGVDAQRRAGVGVGVGPEPSGGHDRQALELQPAGDVRQRAPGGQVDPGEVVDEDDDRGALGGVDEQVTGGEGDGERLDGLVRRFDRQGAEDRRPPSRGEALDPVQGAVEHPGQSRPGQLDLGLDAVAGAGCGTPAGRRRSAPRLRRAPPSCRSRTHR